MRLVRDPAMQAVVGHRALDREAASTKTLSWFETEDLVTGGNLKGEVLALTRLRGLGGSSREAGCRAAPRIRTAVGGLRGSGRV